MNAALKTKIFSLLNSLLFLGSVLGLIIWAEQFFPNYSGYVLDFLGLAITLVAVHFGEKHLREFQSSHELFLGLLVPFILATTLSWYSLQNAKLEIVQIHTRVINAQTNEALHGAVVLCLSEPSLRWETDSFGQVHIALANVSREEPLIFYAHLKGFHNGILEIESNRIREKITLLESIKLSPDNLFEH